MCTRARERERVKGGKECVADRKKKKREKGKIKQKASSTPHFIGDADAARHPIQIQVFTTARPHEIQHSLVPVLSSSPSPLSLPPSTTSPLHHFTTPLLNHFTTQPLHHSTQNQCVTSVYTIHAARADSSTAPASSTVPLRVSHYRSSTSASCLHAFDTHFPLGLSGTRHTRRVVVCSISRLINWLTGTRLAPPQSQSRRTRR